MIRVGYAEAPVVGQGLRSRWATTTSTVGECEFNDVSASSEVLPYTGREFVLAVIPYTASIYVLPHHSGLAVLCEGAAEQVGIFEDAVVTSSVGPYSRVAEAWNASWGAQTKLHRKHLPPPSSAEDLLDWEVAIHAAPPRPSGTISVTLRYAGRSVPTPAVDPADE